MFEPSKQAKPSLRSKFIEVDGLKCHYLDEGEGPVLLCLHPAPGSCLFFERLVHRLQHRFRVIAPDFPGFGQSTVPNEFSLENLRGFVISFMDAMKLDSVALLVNDASGSVGLGAATDAPERFQSLVITDTFAFPLTGKLFPVKLVLRYAMPIIRLPNRWFNLLPLLVSTLGCFWNPLSRKERIAYLKAFEKPKQRDRIIQWFQNLGGATEYLQQLEHSIRHKLSEHRSLIVYGQFDPMRILGAANKFRQLLPHSELHLIPWEEHFPVLGSTDRVAQVIEQWFEE